MPARPGSNPYAFTTAPLSLSKNTTHPRRIDWTFTAPDIENDQGEPQPAVVGVTAVHLRFRQSPDTETNDGKVTEVDVAARSLSICHAFG